MAKNIQRMNYFNGLFLTETEFNLEQDYHIRMRRLHNRWLHGWGIVWGLDVEQTGESTVKITNGMALNQINVKDGTYEEELSKEIIRTSEEPEIDFKIYEYTGDVWVFISYLEQKVGHTQKNKEGLDENIHLQETAKIEISNIIPDGPEHVILAKVKLDGNKKIEDIDTSDRQQAGFKAPSMSSDAMQTKKLTLAIENIDTGLASIKGKEFNGTHGILVDSEHTEFSGPLTINGDVDITGNLILENNNTVDGRDVSADGTTLDTHVDDITSNPHGITATMIDGHDDRIVAQINAGNGNCKIENRMLDFSGWVKLPFLPKKYGTSGYEFKHGINNSTTSSDGGSGLMEIPIPPNVTKIKTFKIAGKKIKKNTNVKIVRSDLYSILNSDGTYKLMIEFKVILDKDLEEEKNNFVIDFDYINFKDQILDEEWNSLVLLVETDNETDIWFIGAEFE